LSIVGRAGRRVIGSLKFIQNPVFLVCFNTYKLGTRAEPHPTVLITLVASRTQSDFHPPTYQIPTLFLSPEVFGAHPFPYRRANRNRAHSLHTAAVRL